MTQNPPAIQETQETESGRSPGKEDGYPLQYSCLENPMNRRAQRATVCRVAQSRTRLKRLNMHTGTNKVGLLPQSTAFSRSNCHFPPTFSHCRSCFHIVPYTHTASRSMRTKEKMEEIKWSHKWEDLISYIRTVYLSRQI